MKTHSSLQENIIQFERKQIIVSLLVLLIMTGLSIISNRLFMMASAEQTEKLITRMVQNGYFHEIELTLQSAKLEYFHKIQFQSKALNRSFTFPPLAEYLQEKSFLDSLIYEKIELSPQTIATKSTEDRIVFEYNRFNFVPYALLIWFILNLVSIPQTRLIKNRIIEQFKKDLELNKKSAQAEISRKVRHNINTPLAALIAMTDRLENLGKTDQLLFESIVKQIKSLVKDLDTSEKESGVNSVSSQKNLSAYQIIQESFREVKIAFDKKFEIDFDIQNSLMSGRLKVIPHEFRSIISNLVQNSTEASNRGDKIILSAKDLSNQLEVKIKDFGKGIPKAIIERVTEKNFTHGKINGSGLGLYHAKSWVDAWGGTLLINSEDGTGTTITILLPFSERASWFTPRIKIKSDQTVVILDDQLSQHHIWDLKLSESEFHGVIKKFKSPEDFKAFKDYEFDLEQASNFIFFFDYDLGSDFISGVDLLKGLPRSSQRYLVTGHFDEPEIQDLCEQEGITLISKTELPFMPLVCTH